MLKKIMSKVSSLALVMFVATAMESVTFGCAWVLYQPKEPEKLGNEEY